MEFRWSKRAMLVLASVLVLALAPASLTLAQTSDEPSGKTEGTEGPLANGQRQVGQRFRDLEKLLLRMAELTAPSDPKRAALLRQAVAQSSERDIDSQFDQLVELLRQEKLSAAVKGQRTVQDDLNKLLELLLSEDRGKRLENEKERIREYLKRVNKIIKDQKSVQGDTSREGDAKKLADRQGDLADKTSELAQDLSDEARSRQAAQGKPQSDDKKQPQQDKGDQKPGGEKGKPGDKNDQSEQDKSDKDKSDKDKSDKPQDKDAHDKKDARGRDRDKKDDNQKDGDPSGGRPKDGDDQKSEGRPGSPKDDQGDSQSQDSQSGGDEPPEGDNPAQKRVEQAQKRMKEAQQKLEEAKRRDATDKQTEALKELEAAKAELEEILRQLREEEMARTLAMLEGRFRKMLDAQVEVYEGTKRLDAVAEPDRDRDDEIESGRLSRKETQIATDADKALAVLKEEGSAVAFPEAVAEMRDDMQSVAKRLAETKVGEMTQGIERDIIAALEEMIASLKKAQKDMEQKSQQGQPMEAGETEPPLVDTLAELKMIRALQMRVNVRTQRYADLTKTEQAETKELLDALQKLAEREQRIHKVTRDIVLGRNK
jgi:hypothetical protein